MGLRSGRSSASGAEFDVSNPNSFFPTVRSVVLEPVRFFAGLRARGNVVNPLVFAVICYFVSVLLGGILAAAGLGAGTTGLAGEGFVGFVGALVLSPVIAVVGVLVLAAILYGFVSFLVRPNAGFEASLRTVAYSFVVYLVAWIPIIGWILALYGLYLVFVGTREMHRTTPQNALIALAGTLVVGLVLALILGGAVAGLFFVN
jgi:hypothetical protein